MVNKTPLAALRGQVRAPLLLIPSTIKSRASH